MGHVADPGRGAHGLGAFVGMKITAQEEYGLRCLLRVAHGDGEPVTISQICKAEGISQPNVAKMMRLLRRGGFVKSIRGHDGGYELARQPEEIAVGEVLAFLGGRLYDHQFCDTRGGGADSCRHLSGCRVRSLWLRIQIAVDHSLRRITLSDLLQGEDQELIRLGPPVPAP